MRGVVFAVAIALGAVAVWLIVTSTTQKRIELGILAGLWGLLLGTFSMLGSRRSMLPAADARPVAAAAAFDGTSQDGAGGAAIQVRANAEVERIEETLERRAWQARLEQMLRREIQDAMNHEVSALRSEIASLRGELLEKVGGQLRLERIETTRVIGSDLEALQHEVHQLKVAQGTEFGADMSELARPAVVTPPASRPAVEPATPPAPVPEPVPAPIADPVPEPLAPIADPVPEPVPEPVAEPLAPDPSAAAAPPARIDDFASLPRLSPFVDIGPEPAPRAEPATSPSGYRGRRRRLDDQDGADDETRAARHAERSAGRRHRRDDDEDGADGDLLSRLLSREGAR